MMEENKIKRQAMQHVDHKLPEKHVQPVFSSYNIDKKHRKLFN